MKTGDDFVEVKLSAAGEQLAAGSPVELGGPNYHFRFEPGKSQSVTRVLDWQRVLEKERVEGEPMFEMVALRPAAPKPKAEVSAPKISEEK